MSVSACLVATRCSSTVQGRALQLCPPSTLRHSHTDLPRTHPSFALPLVATCLDAVYACVVMYQVAHDTGKAEKLNAQADEVDDSVAKEFAEKSANVVMFEEGILLDVSREDMGMVAVSQAVSTLGRIQSVNSVVLNMFGYSKRDLVGKNIKTIVPAPWCGVHDLYLRAFAETGHPVRHAS